ncbi:MAG: aminoacyl-tRNA hydrolase [Blastocatellia bacterium]|nr:aminoacyl-tRNA hydrolase [Blastocatellia bacterium]
MKIVVGLGNPGERYAGTRHNIGFQVVDQLAAQAGRPIKLSECEALTGRVTLAGEPVLLVKPLTFMNLSGQAVAPLCSKYDADPVRDVLAVVDDIALPFGKLRVRAKGSAGGHNGLKSLIARLHTQDFARLRVGILPEHQVGNLADFVLARFSALEKQALAEVLNQSCEAIEMWVTHGVEPTMAKFN